jgi:2-(1,2-epoxy-1,2-dihydrophenyl)acetyl-CoA isomerase
MKFTTVVFERRAGLGVVTLNRPERLNALNLPLVADLTAAAAAIEADGSLRAVLLCGAGRAFCAGADLAQDGLLGAGGDESQSRGERIGAALREHLNPMVQAWYRLSVPVVVAVNGIAAGAGSSLALAGDIVLAARSASFIQLFAPKLGLMPDLGATYHLPRLVGTARAKGLALLGEPLSATEAAQWGLIWSAVADADLAAESLRIAQRLADGPTRAYAAIKAAMNVAARDSLDARLDAEARAQALLGDTADVAEGLAAFRDKRPPRFTGR